MQRIKLDVFKTLFEKDLTGNEIDFLVALTHMQNERGEAHGVHYKEMMEAANISIQAFYDCKKTLEQKGVIKVKPVHNDYDIIFIGNDFSMYTDKDYKKGKVPYLSTNQRMFYDINWKKLKPKQKLLAMDLLNINKASSMRTYRVGRDKFIEKYANKANEDGSVEKGLLDIDKRTLQKYLKLLKLYFCIGIKDGLYWITIRKPFAKRVVECERDVANEHLLLVACRRNRIKERDENEEKGILSVLRGLRKKIMHSLVYIPNVFSEMLEIINDRVSNTRKWSRRLKASLFIKLLTKELDNVATA